MRLAVSSIGWAHEFDPTVAAVLTSAGLDAIEVAPYRRWADPLGVPAVEVRACRSDWLSMGLEVVAVQSLVFGRSDLLLFGSNAARAGLLDHLARMCGLAAALGAPVVVFGAPKNRIVGPDLTPGAAWEIAVQFFRDLAVAAHDAGVVFCIEPNPPQYGGNFITTSGEGLRLVEEVDHPGFGLHLDAAAMTLAGEDPQGLRDLARRIRHFHASEPYLAPLGSGQVDHPRFASALADGAYPGVVSLEMLVPPEQPLERSFAASVAELVSAYASPRP